MDRGRRARPVRPGRHRHGCQLRPGIRHRSRPRRQGCPRRARGAQSRQGQGSRRPHQEGEPDRDRRIAGAGPDLTGQRPQGRRRPARRPPAHRPADQQRRRDVRAVPGDHQGRLRDAVRHQPSRPLRVDGSAARRTSCRSRARGWSPSAASATASWPESISRTRNSSASTTGSRPTDSPSSPNLLFTYDLQRRLAAKGAPTVALAAHPGLSNTELMRYLPGPLHPGLPWKPVAQRRDGRTAPSARPPTPAHEAASTTVPTASEK